MPSGSQLIEPFFLELEVPSGGRSRLSVSYAVSVRYGPWGASFLLIYSLARQKPYPFDKNTKISKYLLVRFVSCQ
jgi:hypothetical protein